MACFVPENTFCYDLNPADELIRFYAKQLKISVLVENQEILQQAALSVAFPDLLLERMKAKAPIPTGGPE